MPKIDVTDEAIIDSPPLVVYNAILAEFSGITHWWMPYLGFKLRGDAPVDHEGAVFDLTVFPKSRIMQSKISVKVNKIVEAKSIELDFSGDFLGTEKYTFEPTNEGKTKLQIHLDAKTNRLALSLFSPFIGKGHSGNMQKGFKACSSYLCKK